MIEKTVDAFGCKAVDGVVSHQIKRFTIDGTKVITNKNVPGHQVEECEIKQHEAYAIDVVVSTGEGKCREMDTKCTVFKRAPDQKYNLRMKTAREVTFLSLSVGCGNVSDVSFLPVQKFIFCI